MGNDWSSKDLDSDRIEHDQSGSSKVVPFQTNRISPSAFVAMRNYATGPTPTSSAIDGEPLDFLDLSLVRSMIQ